MRARTLLPALLIAAVAPLAADAQTAAHMDDLLNAPAACAPFTPTTQVRNSAGGVRNGGTTTVYLVCGVQSQLYGDAENGASLVQVYVANTGTTSQRVSCSLRPGYSLDGVSTNEGVLPKSVTVAAAAGAPIIWSYDEYGSALFSTPNITCSLPPGMTLTLVRATRTASTF